MIGVPLRECLSELCFEQKSALEIESSFFRLTLGKSQHFRSDCYVRLGGASPSAFEVPGVLKPFEGQITDHRREKWRRVAAADAASCGRLGIRPR